MFENLFILVFIFVIGYLIFVKGTAFKSIGQVVGECIEVKVEYGRENGSPYKGQLRGMDSRMYRPIIKYTWEGTEYIAKSYNAYGQAKLFPGDKVQVLVSPSDKSVVKIL